MSLTQSPYHECKIKDINSNESFNSFIIGEIKHKFPAKQVASHKVLKFFFEDDTGMICINVWNYDIERLKDELNDSFKLKIQNFLVRPENKQFPMTQHVYEINLTSKTSIFIQEIKNNPIKNLIQPIIHGYILFFYINHKKEKCYIINTYDLNQNIFKNEEEFELNTFLSLENYELDGIKLISNLNSKFNYLNPSFSILEWALNFHDYSTLFEIKENLSQLIDIRDQYFLILGMIKINFDSKFEIFDYTGSLILDKGKSFFLHSENIIIDSKINGYYELLIKFNKKKLSLKLLSIRIPKIESINQN